MHVNQLLQQVQTVLCLNGPLSAQLCEPLPANVFLVACDGAANRLQQLGRLPNLIVGDGDSLQMTPVLQPIERVQLDRQDNSDFEKTLQVLQDRDLWPDLILGGTGGEFDHVLQNLWIMARMAQQQPVLMLTEASAHSRQLAVITRQDLCLDIAQGATLSIMPMVTAVLSSDGLKWPLTQQSLSYLAKSSARNQVTASPVSLTVHQGCCWVIVDYDALLN